MIQLELRGMATHLATVQQEYNSWCERYVDKLSDADRYAVICNLSSIAASAAYLTCVLVDREH